nr:potassium channel protein [Nakamurella flavida]
MSYTATTIGFGELPVPFSTPQRIWVTAAIYLSVIGWAYAIGTLLSLIQDRSFRSALARQRFRRTVSRIREPFVLIAGFGRAGELLGGSLDELGRQFVVLDVAADRIDALDLSTYRGDIPGLVADAADPHFLGLAGLESPYCTAVAALTDDDEVNLAVTMATSLLRPDVTVVARTSSRSVGNRMAAFGASGVVNPFDRFGDHLRTALRSPASYQLLSWLEAGPGAPLPDRERPPSHGHWVICGYGRFGREMTADLTAEGLQVTVIDPRPQAQEDHERDEHPPHGRASSTEFVLGDGSEPDLLERADLAHAVGFVAGTDNDTANLSLLAAARRINPDLFLGARQNRSSNAPLYAAMTVTSLLVPAETVAHEVYAQLSTPLLWRFLQEMPGRGEEFAADLVHRLTRDCGHELPALWKIQLDGELAPAVRSWLTAGGATLGDLLRNPENRSERLPVVVLIVAGTERTALAPADDVELLPGDELLLAGRPVDRREVETTLLSEATAALVLHGREEPAGWVWRRLGGTGRSG